MGEILHALIAIFMFQETIFVNGSFCDLAKGRPTSASTGASISGRGADGNRNTNFHALSCWEAAVNDMNPYWMVDLGRKFKILSVSVTNRGDCCPERLHDFAIEAFLDDPSQVPSAPYSLCHSYTGAVGAGATESLDCSEPQVVGRYVRVRGLNTLNENDRFHLCEVEVCADISSCFEYAFMQHFQTRNAGTVTVLSDTSRVDCASICSRHSICGAFNYNKDSSICELVTASGALVSSPEWDYFQINMSSS